MFEIQLPIRYNDNVVLLVFIESIVFKKWAIHGLILIIFNFLSKNNQKHYFDDSRILTRIVGEEGTYADHDNPQWQSTTHDNQQKYLFCCCFWPSILEWHELIHFKRLFEPIFHLSQEGHASNLVAAAVKNETRRISGVMCV